MILLLGNFGLGLSFDTFFVPLDGRMKGLCLTWNSEVVSSFIVNNGSRWLSIAFPLEGHLARIILIYAPNNPADRNSFWEEIRP